MIGNDDPIWLNVQTPQSWPLTREEQALIFSQNLPVDSSRTDYQWSQNWNTTFEKHKESYQRPKHVSSSKTSTNGESKKSRQNSEIHLVIEKLAAEMDKLVIEVPEQQNEEDILHSAKHFNKFGTERKKVSDEKVHIEEELSKQNLYKTELCRSFTENGTCRYGHKCQFAHGSHELRPVLRHPKYKTEICKTFSTNGKCPYGNRCRFIHQVINSTGSLKKYPEYQEQASPITSHIPEQEQSFIRKVSPVELPSYRPAVSSEHRENSIPRRQSQQDMLSPSLSSPFASKSMPIGATLSQAVSWSNSWNKDSFSLSSTSNAYHYPPLCTEQEGFKVASSNTYEQFQSIPFLPERPLLDPRVLESNDQNRVQTASDEDNKKHQPGSLFYLSPPPKQYLSQSSDSQLATASGDDIAVDNSASQLVGLSFPDLDENITNEERQRRLAIFQKLTN